MSHDIDEEVDPLDTNIPALHRFPSAANEHVAAIAASTGFTTEHQDSFEIDGPNARSHARLLSDGRVDVSIFHRKPISHALKVALHQQVRENDLSKLKHTASALKGFKDVPKLNIVIHIVGSRGDVQPFIALAKVLIAPPYSHRVRFCTHPVFKDFVEEHGLEFFSIGGDPAQLMAYMVKNPGLIPGLESIRAGDIGKRRAGIAENLVNAWRSCIEPTPLPGEDRVPFTGKNESRPGKPFIADAIIANPPSFAHLHCAEKLHIPLHLMFTMPWSPTQVFPHPLANIASSNVDHAISNFLSYPLMDLMTWQGIGDIINEFRVHTLKLEPVSALWAGGLVSRLQVPFTYCWSDALIPKPRDWGPYINIAGFYFLEGASKYKPPPELAKFLDAGPPPIYIGFGSIVVKDPARLTDMIFTAVKNCGIRALVSKGWGELGGSNLDMPENIHLLGNIPHDWLFPRVSAVVHHGGAGTTATGIASGKPTVVVPFFGDQGFWGAMIARAGAGPKPIPFKQMTVDSLTESIKFALKPETLERAKVLANQIQNEDGKVEGARLFHEALDVDTMRCMLDPHRVAVWQVKWTKLRLSAFAATVLAKKGLIQEKHFQLIWHNTWDLDEGPEGPLSGGIAALVGSLTDFMLGIGHLSTSIVKAGVHELHQIPRSKSMSARRSMDVYNGYNGLASPNRSASVPASRAGSIMQKPEEETEATPRRKSDSRVLERWKKAQINPVYLNSRKNIAAAFPGRLINHGDAGTSVFLERRKRAKLVKSTKQAERHARKSMQMEQEEAEELALALDNDPHVEDDMGAKDYVMDILGAGGKVTKVLVKLPMEITYNIANGFHNAPILFLGDETVRAHYPIKGVGSGLVAAGREFTLGFYDGITGLVYQPYLGARRDGTAGFFKGVARGIGGLLLKTQAGIWGIPGYSFKGIHKELRKFKGPGIEKYIHGSRIIQGLRQYDAATEEERDKIVERWEHAASQLKMKSGGWPWRRGKAE